MKYFNSPYIYYLEPFDFDNDLSILVRDDIINEYTDNPLFSDLSIIMVQGNFCGYCTSFKPHFQKVAEELRTIDFGTIQIDGDDTEFYRKNIDSIINTPLQGVPTVIKLYKGRPIDMYNGNLQYADFKRWVLNN